MSALALDPVSFLASKIREANEVGNKIRAATSDSAAQIKDILDHSTAPEMVKFRELVQKCDDVIAQAQAKKDSAIAQAKDAARALLPGHDENFDVEAAKKDFAAKRRDAHAARQAILALGVSEEQLNEALANAGVETEVIALRGTGGGSKGASGIRRPRIAAATVNGREVSKDGKTSFTLVNAEMKKYAKASSVGALQNRIFEAAGTEDLSTLPGGTVISAQFPVGNENGEHIPFTVTTPEKDESN